ncbi:MAG TPA: hypothetical protein VFY71_10205 [Planctomycetota bacterium]|nr:hypothetical protein [Planctomycetota bacterium]
MKIATPYVLSCLAALLLAGCDAIGPRSIPVDRSDYSTSIAESWKQQTLLNIVKLRYMDLPVFVEVASIVAGYSMQTGVALTGTSSSPSAVQGDFLSAGGSAVYTDRPTITYVPMTGEKFLRALITPIDPKNIFFMLQAGYAADFILGLTVDSLNGVRNRSASGGKVREADADFVKAVQLIREVQLAGAVGMRVKVDKATGDSAVLLIRRDDIPDDVRAKAAEIRRLLGLPADQQEFKLVYSQGRGAPDELAVNSRSMLQIMGAFATYADVPQADVDAHRALPSLEKSPEGTVEQLVHIHSGKEQPQGAFASVFYRDSWFWVADDDLFTKRALTAVVFFFTLMGERGEEPLPLVTIPAQ